jgi:hypothetical protein
MRWLFVVIFDPNSIFDPNFFFHPQFLFPSRSSFFDLKILWFSNLSCSIWNRLKRNFELCI